MRYPYPLYHDSCGSLWRSVEGYGSLSVRPMEARRSLWWSMKAYGLHSMEVYGSRQRSTRTGSQNYMVIEKDNSCLGELQLEGRLWSFLIVPNSLYGNSVDSCACGCARPFRPHTNTLVNRERERVPFPRLQSACVYFGCTLGCNRRMRMSLHVARHNDPSQCPVCTVNKPVKFTEWRLDENAFCVHKIHSAKIISESSRWSGLRSIGV